MARTKKPETIVAQQDQVQRFGKATGRVEMVILGGVKAAQSEVEARFTTKDGGVKILSIPAAVQVIEVMTDC